MKTRHLRYFIILIGLIAIALFFLMIEKQRIKKLGFLAPFYSLMENLFSTPFLDYTNQALDVDSFGFVDAATEAGVQNKLNVIHHGLSLGDSGQQLAVDPETRKYAYPIPKRLALRSIEREGIGYPKGYATFEALLAPDFLPGLLLFPMMDIRGHHLYNDQYAANAGLVARYIPKSRCQIFGLNVYYDFRQGDLGNYQRLGVGMEILGDRVDFRFNGYIGVQKHTQKCVFDQFVGGFFAIFREKEFSYQGFNAELGALLVKSPAEKFHLYAAVGPYYLSGKYHQKTWGGRVRLRPQYRDYLALELSSSYDHIFKTIFQAEIIFTIPLYQFGSKKSKKSSCLSDRRVYQPVQRFEIIPLNKKCGWETNF